MISKLLKDTKIYSSGQILPRLIAFLLLPVISRFLTAEDYGVLGQMAILSLVATSIVNLGFNMSINKVYFETSSKHVQGGLIWSSFLALLFFNALLFALVYVLASPLSTLLLGTSKHSELILLAFASVSISGLIVPFTTYLKLEQKALMVVTLAVIEVLTASALTLYFVIGKGFGAYGPLLAQLIAQGLLFILFIGIALFRVRLKPYFGKEFWEALFLGLPYTLSFFGSFLIQSGTRFALVEMRGLEEGGIYFVSQTCAKVLELFIMGMMAAWLPLFARIANDKEQSAAAIKKVISTFILIASVPIAGAFLFAKPVLSLLVPETLASGWSVVGILALSQGVFGIYAIMQPVFVFNKRSIFQVLLEGAAGVIGVGAALILTPEYGIKGAAAAQITACTVLLIAAIVILRRLIPITFNKELLKKVALALGAIIISSLYLPDNLIMQFLEGSIIFSIFIYFLWKEYATFQVVSNQREIYEN